MTYLMKMTGKRLVVQMFTVHLSTEITIYPAHIGAVAFSERLRWDIVCMSLYGAFISCVRSMDLILTYNESFNSVVVRGHVWNANLPLWKTNRNFRKEGNNNTTENFALIPDHCSKLKMQEKTKGLLKMVLWLALTLQAESEKGKPFSKLNNKKIW